MYNKKNMDAEKQNSPTKIFRKSKKNKKPQNLIPWVQILARQSQMGFIRTKQKPTIQWAWWCSYRKMHSHVIGTRAGGTAIAIGWRRVADTVKSELDRGGGGGDRDQEWGPSPKGKRPSCNTRTCTARGGIPLAWHDVYGCDWLIMWRGWTK